MEAGAWKQLFDSIRPEDQECLVVSVSGGLDIAVQAIAKVEDEVVLLRGRVSGQADVGRIFVVPYGSLNSIYVNRYVQVEETELFSPSVSKQRKDQIAKMVVAMREKAREDAQASESSRPGSGGGGAISQDVRKQLEELREKKANMAAASSQVPALPPASPGSQKPTTSPPVSVNPAPSPTTSRPGLPPRVTLPKGPRSDNQ